MVSVVLLVVIVDPSFETLLHLLYCMYISSDTNKERNYVETDANAAEVI
jgi:hypothetical protein